MARACNGALEHFSTVWILANHARAVLSLAGSALLAAALASGRW